MPLAPTPAAPIGRERLAVTLGELDAVQARQLLAAKRLGRLTCDLGGRSSVLPVRYYMRDATHIDVETPDAACRTLASDGVPVRFEVDDIENPARWSTVIAW